MRSVMGCLLVWVFGSAAAVNAAEDDVASDPALANAGENRVEEILVVGQRENRESRGALVLPMSLFDTPQAVTVVDAGFIEDFGLDDVNQLLNLVTGVNVEQVETDRTYYNARGFDIKSMQVDGIGSALQLERRRRSRHLRLRQGRSDSRRERTADRRRQSVGNDQLHPQAADERHVLQNRSERRFVGQATRRGGSCPVRSRRAARGRAGSSVRRNPAIRISTTTKTSARSSPAYSKVRSATVQP